METTWQEALDCASYKNFGDAKTRWHPGCDDCEFLSLCMGDCLKHRASTGGSLQNLSRLCAGWKLFYQHTLSRFQEIAAQVKAGRIPDEAMVQYHRRKSNPAKTSIGRNSPCPCGSGKKYKRCCGR